MSFEVVWVKWIVEIEGSCVVVLKVEMENIVLGGCASNNNNNNDDRKKMNI